MSVAIICTSANGKRLTMSLLQQRDLIFTHLHLTGALWDQPPRDLFEDRIAAVGKHGGVGMGMGADELERLLTNYGQDKVQAILEEHNVAITEVEILIGWDAPEEYSGPARDRLFGLAEQVGATKVKAAAVAPPGVPMTPHDVLVEQFIKLCDLGAERGLNIALESIAIMPGFSYSQAADVVIAANRPNGKLQIDMWHLFRDPTGLAAVDKVTGSQIAGVELGDGPAQPSANLMDECVNGRLLPGDGEFDVIPLLHKLDAMGVDVPISIEVLNSKLRKLTPGENVSRSIAAIKAFMESARAALD
jgi:sugar phosphate isomerase/epimerase